MSYLIVFKDTKCYGSAAFRDDLNDAIAYAKRRFEEGFCYVEVSKGRDIFFSTYPEPVEPTEELPF